jgi:hypothetical protein
MTAAVPVTTPPVEVATMPVVIRPMVGEASLHDHDRRIDACVRARSERDANNGRGE